ncbi:MAG: PHP domain-containing protein [Candidatus Diapherotrites archaeon]|nr:PHP domain-containing protein [Candidatus Diapherotrites archaeon]
MKLDFHVHSRYSPDAGTHEKRLVELAKEKGIAFAISDHDCCDAWKSIAEHAKKLGVAAVPGEEIMVFEGKTFLGEILASFMLEPVKSNQLFGVLDELKSQDALISVSHPFDGLRKPFKTAYLEQITRKIDAIEGFNSRVHSQSFNEMAQAFAKKHGLAMTAGSDAHFPEEFGRAYAQADTDSVEEFKKLVRKGKATLHGKITGWGPHVKTQFAKRGFLKEPVKKN